MPITPAGTKLTLAFRIVLAAGIESVWEVVEAIGGDRGYYGNRLLWALRGALDAVVGGPGMKKKRRDNATLDADEVFHFWQVSRIHRPRRLVLASRMKVPGEALLVFQLRPLSGHTGAGGAGTFSVQGAAGPGLLVFALSGPPVGFPNHAAQHCPAVQGAPSSWDRRWLRRIRQNHACDTGLFYDMKLIGEAGIDLAVLPIGDNFTMGPDDALRAVQLIEPRLVLPIHYDTFEVIKQDPAALEATG